MSLRISDVVRSHSFAFRQIFLNGDSPLRMDCIQGTIDKLEMGVILVKRTNLDIKWGGGGGLSNPIRTSKISELLLKEDISVQLLFSKENVIGSNT